MGTWIAPDDDDSRCTSLRPEDDIFGCDTSPCFEDNRFNLARIPSPEDGVFDWGTSLCSEDNRLDFARIPRPEDDWIVWETTPWRIVILSMRGGGHSKSLSTSCRARRATDLAARGGRDNKLFSLFMLLYSCCGCSVKARSHRTRRGKN